MTEFFSNLYDSISKESFLKKEALGGEIGFYISAYDARNETQAQEAIKRLKTKLENSGIQVLELNLYDIVCDILDEKGGVERMFKIELTKQKDKFLNALQSTLNIHQILMPRIKEMIDASAAKIYFLTGIGMVFPYIRSHNVLNNLQSIATKCPMLMFFPGEYDGHNLKLFGRLHDDNYYRAFNINSLETK